MSEVRPCHTIYSNVLRKALEYEASFQLSEGVNMAHKTTIMNVYVEEEDEVNFVKDARARSNACF